MLMTKFKFISFSKEISKSFKWINWFILLPILLWPLIFFGSVFFFDDPHANLIFVWILFISVNLYPLFLFGLFELNARLYRKSKTIGYIIPVLVLVGLLYIIGNLFLPSKQFSKERETEDQIRKSLGYIGSCNTYRILNGSVYYRDSLFNADPITFEYLGCHYGKDKNIAFKGKEPIDGSDTETFEIIDQQWQKDKNRYYYQRRSNEQY